MFLPYFGGCVFSKALVVAKIHLLQLPVTGKLGKDTILSHRRQIYSFRRPADLWQHLTDLPAVIQLFQIFPGLFPASAAGVPCLFPLGSGIPVGKHGTDLIHNKALSRRHFHLRLDCCVPLADQRGFLWMDGTAV